MIRGVYLVAGPQTTAGRSPVDVIRSALQGGVSAVQWRWKHLALAPQWPEMLAARDLCRAAGVSFLVNDRVDVALALEADGAHVGMDDLPAVHARRLLPHGILGVSASSAAQVELALSAHPDYLGIGPIFPTGSKSDAGPALGLDFIRVCREMTDLPLVAIGGITLENVQSVARAGADAAAVISAICGAPDPGKAARDLCQAFVGTGVR